MQETVAIAQTELKCDITSRKVSFCHNRIVLSVSDCPDPNPSQRGRGDHCVCSQFAVWQTSSGPLGHPGKRLCYLTSI
jgi:hypothetical protein